MSLESPLKVVYLIGAGASHGCVSRAYRGPGILMGHLSETLIERLRAHVIDKFPDHRSLHDLVNRAIDEDTDFEQIITFLNDSPSKDHRQLANRLREIFHETLNTRLQAIRDELNEETVSLYTALLDMYEVPHFPETLGGLITINYDNYIEYAAQLVTDQPVDFGFSVDGTPESNEAIRLLKLHGSFGWTDTWPIMSGNGESPLWIPPGIQKEKQMYPFNILWGLAREMLTCDVLRIIGCRLGPNDWDLISLLFSTCHVSSEYNPYRIEIIDAPSNAQRIKEQFPYLGVRSILEAEWAGNRITAELTEDKYATFDEIDPAEVADVCQGIGTDQNWFQVWLRHMAEEMTERLDAIETDKGFFDGILRGA